MSPDLRGFNYSLEPVLARQRWSLDALNSQLGELQRRIGVATNLMSDLENDHQVLSLMLAESLKRAVDPTAYRAKMDWLVRLQGRLATAQQDLVNLHAERARLIVACNAQRQKVDAIEAHRDESVIAFAQVESARLASVADREWLARGLGRREGDPVPSGGWTA